MQLLFKNMVFKTFVFWFICIVLYPISLKYRSPYCVVLITLNVRAKKVFVSDIQAMQYVAVRTAASTDESQAPSDKTLMFSFSYKNDTEKTNQQIIGQFLVAQNCLNIILHKQYWLTVKFDFASHCKRQCSSQIKKLSWNS